MFFKFNQISQSIAATTQDMAMGRPATAKSMAATLTEVPEVHYEYSKPAPKAEVQPKVQSGYPVPKDPRYKRLMDLQSRLVRDDGKLVWQKLPKDMPLYYLSVVLVTVGVAMTAYTLKQLATPPKNE